MKSLGYQAWLAEEKWHDTERIEALRPLLGQITATINSDRGPGRTAIEELTTAISAFTGIRPELSVRTGPARIVLGSADTASSVADKLKAHPLSEEGYNICSSTEDGHPYAVLYGGGEKGLLYAVFHLLRLLGTSAELADLNVSQSPRNRLRMINQWDNMDGSVERGYSGGSIFYRENRVLLESGRIRDYARLLASVGINAISINNVNVHREETKLITEALLPDVARLADVFGQYGIRLFLSVNYAAPMELGDLSTADPLDEEVQKWWRDKAGEIYRSIPDFGGFLVKADSENRPGPFTYGRDHADGANMLADALAPYGGLVLWRCFVYDCHQDWRDRSTDRARAAYDHFRPLDGRFRDNVILQIKNGPMDFQVREPVSPLFGAMEHTNQMMEFQIAQEYTGQQRDVCFLVPQWKQALDFDTGLKGPGSTVKRIASGELHPYLHSGVTGVSNIGDDENWTGHHLAQANLFGFGRLAWDPDLSAEEIAQEWSRLTFGNEGKVAATVREILLESWRIYESYTAPLGVGWMVQPHYHYAVDVDGYEYSKWGTYHFADRNGIGVDRTISTGTGYTSQYASANRERYESLASCPDELLLFFHHVPYTHVLHSGKTVIQHIYDTHFEGVERVEAWIRRWQELISEVDSERFEQIAERLGWQLNNAKQWRDVINTYFYRKSGIPDAQGRFIY
ncbi:alpha-glucuronidase family glycosyl hydrolase [Paenibacillus chibensis]|uniref:alpha-glucuronidase family glycosyl hydrolase n=1 Tax=Paenibacillus chibensis TaxID=59846 RepID=UPI000FD8CD97|nr:alpha-glucuronidase family glycosyl hydrolase [Paenibacillus chibensis]MEC0369643.1 alpha-glucuronidase family glycosyl hydrolase [Paenibacillus chibensis]